MRTMQENGILQAAAGISLIKQSQILFWSEEKKCFCCQKKEIFDLFWKKQDEIFGRLSCWILFSSGIELIVKGTLLINNKKIKKEVKNKKEKDKTLCELICCDLKNLFIEKNKKSDAEFVCNCLSKFRDSIRNRDIHSYIPNVRDGNFNKSSKYCKSINILLVLASNIPEKEMPWDDEVKRLIHQP